MLRRIRRIARNWRVRHLLDAGGQPRGENASELSTFHFSYSRVEPEEEEVELDDSLVVVDKCKWKRRS